MCGVAAAQARVEPRPGVRPGTAPAAAPAGAPGTGAAQATRTQAGQQAGQQHSADQEIAAKIYGGARNEVELARFAQERAQDDEVKDFAAMMIKEHQPQVQKMGKMAGGLVNASAASAEGRTETRTETRRVDPDANDSGSEGARRDDDRRDDARREGRDDGARANDRREERGAARGGEARGDEARGSEGATTRTTTTTTAGAAGHGAIDWNMVHAQVADQCLKSTREELGRFKGADFDKAYMGQQIVAHMQMIDELKVLRSHATSQLQQEIDDGIEHAEHHLQEARKIMNDEKDKGSTGSSGRESGKRKASNREE